MAEGVSLKKYYLAQIQRREAEINEKIQNIKRLEAQRFELNSNGTPSPTQYHDSRRNCTPCRRTTPTWEKWSRSWARTAYS